MSNEENPNLIKVIRLSDGLIMDFKLLMKHPNIIAANDLQVVAVLTQNLIR